MGRPPLITSQERVHIQINNTRSSVRGVTFTIANTKSPAPYFYVAALFRFLLVLLKSASFSSCELENEYVYEAPRKKIFYNGSQMKKGVWDTWHVYRTKNFFLSREDITLVILLVLALLGFAVFPRQIFCILGFRNAANEKVRIKLKHALLTTVLQWLISTIPF